MYTAKRERTEFCVFEEEAYTNSIKRLILSGELRAAVENQNLYLCYQPKVNIETGKVLGFEALMRWKHRHYGIVPPLEFIEMAERSGII